MKKIWIFLALCMLTLACKDGISEKIVSAENPFLDNLIMSDESGIIELDYEAETISKLEYLGGPVLETDMIYTTPIFSRSYTKTKITENGDFESEITDLTPSNKIKSDDPERKEEAKLYRKVIKNGQLEVFDQVNKSLGRQNMPTENIKPYLEDLRKAKKEKGNINIAGKFIGYDAEVMINMAKKKGAKSKKINENISEVEIEMEDYSNQMNKQYKMKYKIDHKNNVLLSGELRERKSNEILHQVVFTYKTDDFGQLQIAKTFAETFQKNEVSGRNEKITTVTSFSNFKISDNL